jgi:integrase
MLHQRHYVRDVETQLFPNKENLGKLGKAPHHRRARSRPRLGPLPDLASVVAIASQASHNRLSQQLLTAPPAPLSDAIVSYKLGTRHTWTDRELAAFEARWPLGTRERLAYALLLHTAQRCGDVAKMRRADIAGGMIAVVQQKTGTALSIPIHSELTTALKAGPSNGLNLIGAADGRPITSATLTDLIKRAAAAAGLPAHCLPHGLRKAQMRRLAESGASTKQIAAVSGHKTLQEVERYTAAADQRRLSKSAIAKLRPRTERDD